LADAVRGDVAKEAGLESTAPAKRVRQGGTAFNVFARIEISDIKDLWPFFRYC
jgi:hypothetical protein